ncbi:MAG: DEAD/DEAH box helicase [Bacteroidota bacterium]
MTRKKYGITWWGKQWLNALSNIDYSNRLPRGRTYANKGLVRSTEINENHITAEVQGSRPNPYRIDISVPLFSEENNKHLVEEVIRNPALVAQLLNRQLPNELLQFAENHGIQVFPRTWRDFDMKCSCPDWAVPCKHLAAVIYSVAEEIDRNPFLVFELHGLDLVQALEDRNIRVEEQKEVRITQLKELIFNQKKKASPNDLPFSFGNLPSLDFTTIPNVGNQLLTLYKPQPLFYEKDFKAIIEKLYKRTSRAANKMLRGNTIPDKRLLEFVARDHIQLVFDENLLLKYIEVRNKKGELKPVKFNGLRFLINTLLAWDEEQLNRCHPSIVALFEVFNFSLHLSKNGAIVPQLLACSHDEFRIRWLPAVIVEEVADLFDKIKTIIPPNLLCVDMADGKHYQSPKEILYSLCSLFIGNCVADGAWFEEHPLPPMFFFTTDSQPLRFDKPKQEVEIILPKSQDQRGSYGRFGWYPSSPKIKTRIIGHKLPPDSPQLIQLWLNQFYLTHKDLVPLVKVEDLDGRFSVELEVENRSKPMQPPVSLNHFFTRKKFAKVKYAVLKDLLLLTDYFPQLNQIIESQGKKHLTFNEQEFVEVLLKILPALSLFGIRILLPKGLKHLVRPQASLMAKKSPGQNDGSFLTFEDLMSFDWQVALGDQLVSVKEFRRLVQNLNGIVKIRDQYVLVDVDELTKLFKKLEEPPRLKGFEALQVLLAEEYQGTKIGLTDEAAALIRQLVQPAAVPLPAGLNATLRPYQQIGYEWMLKNIRLGFGSLLADDMGLGKTIQVIAALLRFQEEGLLEKKKALVIVPTSLLTNWKKEIEKFAPGLRAVIYHGQKRSLNLEDTDVVLTTYGIARSEQARFKKEKWYCTVIDEAQNIKNAGTAQAKNIKAIPASVRVALTGTPVENRLSEFWSIMDFTNKGYLGSPKKFAQLFGKPIQREGNQQQAELFRKITAPFILRRLKSDKTIIADLPEKIENNQFATLTKQQAAIYETVVQQNMKGIFKEKEQIKRQGKVLKMITALKQICNHPYQYLKKDDKSADRSGKAQLLFSLLENIYENNEKTLIFTQYHEMGQLLTQMIKNNFDKEPLFLHGGTSRKKRDEMVEAFQRPDQFPGENDTFILSLKAGGTGLNLTAASNVIHYDLWWNPAVEAQATDRAYRIGQQKNVMVWRLITQSTFEEKIDEMIRRKKELANLTVSIGENWIGNMSDQDLEKLVALR